MLRFPREIAAGDTMMKRTILLAMKAGQTVDAATAAFDVGKYPGYKNERVKAAIQAVYDELKQ
jgi:hypothetical protein